MFSLISSVLLSASLLAGGNSLTVCIMIGTPAEMLNRITDNWMRSWPPGTTEIDGIVLTSHLHYVDLTGDANGDLRVDYADVACVSRNWRHSK